MASEEDHIDKMMKPGDCVRVGRNTACEVVVRCPNISGLHCEVEIEPQSPVQEPIQCSVRDLSSNGTWLLPKGEVSKARKLSKGIREDLHLGDHILLLAPFHSSSKQFHFTLVKGPTPSEYILKQLPLEDESDHLTKMDTSNSKPSEVVTSPKECTPCSSEPITTPEPADGKEGAMSSESCRNPLKSSPLDEPYKSSTLSSLVTNGSPCGRTNSSMEKSLSPTTGDKRKLGDRAGEAMEMPKRKKGDSGSVFSLSHNAASQVGAAPTMHIEAESIHAMVPVLVRPTLKREVSKGRCPICLKLYPVTELPIHSAACQERREDNTRDIERDMAVVPEATGSEGERDMAVVPEATVNIGERDMLVVPEATGSEGERDMVVVPEATVNIGERDMPEALGSEGERDIVVVSEATEDEDEKGVVVVISDATTSEEDVRPLPVPHKIPKLEVSPTNAILEQCPTCLKIFPLSELITHSESCYSDRKEKTSTPKLGSATVTSCALAPVVSDSEPHTPRIRTPTRDTSMEQCPKCFKILPLNELIEHSVTSCALAPVVADSEPHTPRIRTPTRDTSMEQCPKCFKILPLNELIEHSVTSCALAPVVADLEPRASRIRTPTRDTSMEQCPKCFKILPLNELIEHSELCVATEESEATPIGSLDETDGRTYDLEPCSSSTALRRAALRPADRPPGPSTSGATLGPGTSGASLGPSTSGATLGPSTSGATLGPGTSGASLGPSTSGATLGPSTSGASLGPSTSGASLGPSTSGATLGPSTSGATLGPSTSGATLGPSTSGATLGPSTSGAVPNTSGATLGPSSSSELEQCVHCLKDYPVEELIAHVSSCPMKDKNKCMIEEHCQHCLKVFPLDELVTHALNCSQRKCLGSLEMEMTDGVMGSQDMWGEPVERCMHCFKDFPLSVLVEHSRRCTGDLSGPRERLKGFLPSIHDLDPMALAVLNDTQMSAVEHVLKVSKKATERLLPRLKEKVLRLGYTEKDLENALQWVRREAPIIIHVRLDSVLGFLVKDTHYRNQFETRTSGGSTDLRARGSWEDRIFNKVYARSPPVDRVKYGVLNIVGDPRGVRSCYSYGDSFLQLKKVRLRTTFASEDTSSGAVVLSCCEYYSNVLYKYTDLELRAILDVATRKKSFLRSDIISTYKEIQIHGPVCLSENVDCIVVNDRHSGDPEIGRLLDVFVERNKCNLIWMEPESEITYPTFDAHPASLGFGTASVFPMAPVYPLPAPPRRRRRHRRRGRRRRARHRYEDLDDEDLDDEDTTEEESDD